MSLCCLLSFNSQGEWHLECSRNITCFHYPYFSPHPLTSSQPSQAHLSVISSEFIQWLFIQWPMAEIWANCEFSLSLIKPHVLLIFVFSLSKDSTLPILSPSPSVGSHFRPFSLLNGLLLEVPIYNLTANSSPWLLRLFLKRTSGYLLLLYIGQLIPKVSKITSKPLSCYIMSFTIWTWTWQPPFWPNLHESVCQLHTFKMSNQDIPSVNNIPF